MLKAALFVLPVAMLAISDARACECASMSVQRRTDASDEVFVARVAKHTPLRVIELEVLEVFKGKPSRRLQVLTGQSDCDFFVKPVQGRPGQKFLVFASKHVDGRTINRCAGTAELGRAKADLKFLRRQRSQGTLR